MQTRFLRMPKLIDLRGKGRSSNYKDVGAGLLTAPVRLGKQAVGWPEHEIEILNLAQLAGKSEDEIRALVEKLHVARKLAA